MINVLPKQQRAEALKAEVDKLKKCIERLEKIQKGELPKGIRFF